MIMGHRQQKCSVYIYYKKLNCLLFKPFINSCTNFSNNIDYSNVVTVL